MDYPGPEGCLYDGNCDLCSISDVFVNRQMAEAERLLAVAAEHGKTGYRWVFVVNCPIARAEYPFS